MSQLFQLLVCQGPSEEAGAFELAVIELLSQDAPVEPVGASGRHQQGGVAVEGRQPGKRPRDAAGGHVRADS